MRKDLTGRILHSPHTLPAIGMSKFIANLKREGYLDFRLTEQGRLLRFIPEPSTFPEFWLGLAQPNYPKLHSQTGESFRYQTFWPIPPLH